MTDRDLSGRSCSDDGTSLDSKRNFSILLFEWPGAEAGLGSYNRSAPNDVYLRYIGEGQTNWMTSGETGLVPAPQITPVTP